MNKILLASHGYLAQGMKSSLEILMGTNDRIECLCAYIDDDSRDVAALIDAWMETRDHVRLSSFVRRRICSPMSKKKSSSSSFNE